LAPEMRHWLEQSKGHDDTRGSVKGGQFLGLAEMQCLEGIVVDSVKK
jgi:hypothetical protein